MYLLEKLTMINESAYMYTCNFRIYYIYVRKRRPERDAVQIDSETVALNLRFLQILVSITCVLSRLKVVIKQI